jgi:WD40 repeat protein
MLAFMLHPISGDDRGTVMTVDVRGTVRTLTPEWSGEGGLAWNPNGKEIWFTATADRDYERTLNAVTPQGKQRIVARFPGSVELKDISNDGRVLLARRDRRFEVVVSDLNGNGRQFSWSQMMRADAVSADGKSVVVTNFARSDSRRFSGTFGPRCRVWHLARQPVGLVYRAQRYRSCSAHFG